MSRLKQIEKEMKKRLKDWKGVDENARPALGLARPGGPRPGHGGRDGQDEDETTMD